MAVKHEIIMPDLGYDRYKGYRSSSIACTCKWTVTFSYSSWSIPTEMARRRFKRHLKFVEARTKWKAQPILIVAMTDSPQAKKTYYISNVFGKVPRGRYRTVQEIKKRQEKFSDNFNPWILWTHTTGGNRWNTEWTYNCYLTKEAALLAVNNRIIKAQERRNTEVHVYEKMSPQAIPLRGMKLVTPTFDEMLRDLARQVDVGRIASRTSTLKKLRKARAMAEMVILEVDAAEARFLSL